MAEPSPPSLERFGDSFRADQWLARFPLTDANVLAYFELSPFFDPDSLNRRATLQGLPLSALAGLQGTLFKVAPSGVPGLFVIERVVRAPPAEDSVVAVYYVLEGTVYQAPHFYALFNARVESIATHLAAAAAHLEQARELP